MRGRAVQDAERLEDAGAFSIVLELVPAMFAELITRALTIPTIGIGAGPHVDGQVLVLPDALGLNESFRLKFLRTFASLADEAKKGISAYATAMREGSYPGAEHSFGVNRLGPSSFNRFRTLVRVCLRSTVL